MVLTKLKTNIFIICKNTEESHKVQKKLFELDTEWFHTGRTLENYGAHIIAVGHEGLMGNYPCNKHIVNALYRDNWEELTPEQVYGKDLLMRSKLVWE